MYRSAYQLALSRSIFISAPCTANCINWELHWCEYAVTCFLASIRYSIIFKIWHHWTMPNVTMYSYVNFLKQLWKLLEQNLNYSPLRTGVWIGKSKIDGDNGLYSRITVQRWFNKASYTTLSKHCPIMCSTLLLPWLFSFSLWIQILVHVGFLTEESGDVFSPKVLKGGPLGEMVQWADILTVLHVLGHNLKISVSLKELHG